jgi:Bacterial Ig domain
MVSSWVVIGELAGCGTSNPSVAPSDAGRSSESAVSEPAALAVALSASSMQVTAAGSIRLSATATGGSGTVQRIEFYEGTTLLATRNASPATLDIAFVEGDNGVHTYTARAYVPETSATSSPLDVTVSIAPDPCGVDRTRCIAKGCPPGLCLSPSHVPSGFGAWSRSRGIHDVTLSGSVVFDTKTGALGALRAPNADATLYEVNAGIGFVRTHQVNGEPDLAIWVFSSLTASGVMATFTGDAAAVLAVAQGATLTGGQLDLAARGPVSGPGGFRGGLFAMDGLGCAGGKGSVSGGGGAAFGSDGAQGGMGAAGLAATCEVAYGELLSLRGGSGGGAGDDGDAASTDPFGGAGGGALQISAFGSLTLDAIVHVGGGAGRTSRGDSHSGSGGGSGGAIFLESPAITIGANAGLYANGGGGGSTSPGAGAACGEPGVAQDGQPSLVAAAGSRCGSGYGGDGAAGAVAAKPGTGNGGGGGGLGRIVLRTLSKATATVSTANSSPGPGSTAFRILQSL